MVYLNGAKVSSGSVVATRHYDQLLLYVSNVERERECTSLIA